MYIYIQILIKANFKIKQSYRCSRSFSAANQNQNILLCQKMNSPEVIPCQFHIFEADRKFLKYFFPEKVVVYSQSGHVTLFKRGRFIINYYKRPDRDSNSGSPHY